jgi:hypothetical protein
MEVTITTAGEATSTIATTTSGRIVTTAVIVITTTNVKRNGRTGLLLIPVTRRSSHHGPKSKHTSKEYTKTPRTINVKFKTKNVNTRRITTMWAIQVMRTSCALAPIHRSQVRTRRQPLARAKKPMRMRIIIFILIKNEGR